MSITVAELYQRIVERILRNDLKFKDTVYDLTQKVLLEEYAEEEVKKLMCSDEMYIMLFSLEEKMRKGARTNGYTMRLVPTKEDGGRWGLPYHFEYYFAKKAN